MFRVHNLSWFLLALTALAETSRGDGRPAQPNSQPASQPSRVYGEWRIRVKPDKGPEYNRLIEQSGLPLFREAGGRMVGWWNTLIGDLYEHVTIWEYDDMVAFERAIQFLSKNSAFAKFVAARDPLLAGEENRFLRLAPGANPPSLPEPAPFVVHEIQRVPLARKDAYLAYMTTQGLALLKANGFHPVGPFVVDVGRWSEVTYILPYQGLADRERIVAKFSTTADARAIGAKLGEFVEEITSRMLVPAPFALKASGGESAPKPTTSAVLPHREQVAPGAFAVGFADRYRSANCGWVALADQTLLIDLPRGMSVADFLALVAATTGKPARTLVLTHVEEGDTAAVRALVERGVTRVVVSPKACARLLASAVALEPHVLRTLSDKAPIGDSSVPVDFIPLDDCAAPAGAAVAMPGAGVLFTGPLVVHGPRAALAGSDTAECVAALRRLEALAPNRVVPGFGSWGGAEMLMRQRRFLTELRRQVGYHIAKGRPHGTLQDEVRIPADCFVWTPYGEPNAEDVEHVYAELTVPTAPFHGRVPRAADSRPHALVLIGDQPHEPGHLEEGLRPVFDAVGVVPHFTVDVSTLSAQNLALVQLLVILRDGLMRPERDSHTHFIWMTPEQEQAVVAFVESGGGFLNLHNAMGLYPPGGKYLDLVGGRYIGHGPLERFGVEVVDTAHPVTRGVGPFFVADEQHTPPYDERRVHLLLRNRSDDGKTAAAGWVREPGRGRLCHLANGHTLEALLHPMYQTLLRNAVRWCVRLDDSATSHRADITPPVSRSIAGSIQELQPRGHVRFSPRQ
jgi:type 1 glutamine amidotransferase